MREDPGIQSLSSHADSRRGAGVADQECKAGSDGEPEQPGSCDSIPFMMRLDRFNGTT